MIELLLQALPEITSASGGGFWEWTIGDVAAVITLGGALGFGIWKGAVPATVTIVNKRLRSWPIGATILSAEWRVPESRASDIFFTVRVKPRRHTVSALASPTIYGWTAVINGGPPQGAFKRDSAAGLSVSRSYDHSWSVTWSLEDFDDRGGPLSLQLVLDVAPPVGEVRKVKTETVLISIHG